MYRTVFELIRENASRLERDRLMMLVIVASRIYESIVSREI